MRGERKTRREYYADRLFVGMCMGCMELSRPGFTRCAECARIAAIKSRQWRQERASKRAMISTERK